MIAAETAIAQPGVSLAFGIAFTVLMGVAAASDIRHRRIPNSIVVLIFSLGALFLTMCIGVRPGAIQLLEGGGTGLLVWLPLWIVGKMGAGDVKFFAASAAWLGPRLALDASLTSALLGGVLALVWMFRRAVEARGEIEVPHQIASCAAVGPRTSDGRQDAEISRITLPYGVAMAAGLTVTAWYPHLIR